MKLFLNSVLLLLIISLFSCGNNVTDKTDKNTLGLYGDTLDIALNQEVSLLDPIKVIDGYSLQVLGQIYEGLLKFNDKDLSLEPMLAESWTIDNSGTIYTFNLKKGVHFQDNKCFSGGKGREFKASDVKKTINRICNVADNYSYNLLKDKIVGASACYNSSEIKEVEGVKIIDDYTVRITLTRPSAIFLQTLATISLAIVPFEAFKNESFIAVGTGPFIADEHFKEHNFITLKRNPTYYIKDEQGNQLPYLDAVRFHFVPSSQERLNLFNKKVLDIIVDLPSASIKDVVENKISDFESKPPKYVLGRFPELITSYIEFNTKVAPFNNPKVRKAIALAIDKTELIDVVLNGEAYGPAINGVVPPALKNYDFESVIGIEYNVEKAQKMLDEAGFKNGEKMPLIKFYISGNEPQTLRVALEIQKQLQLNLNINTEIVSLNFAEKLSLDRMAEGSMGISAWLADYPSPDNFLSIGYGGNIPSSLKDPSFPNTCRFQNQEFDNYYEQAIKTTDEVKRNELYLAAEQILINEAPIIPLWYFENYRLFQSSIIDYQPNVMHIHNLTKVRISNLEANPTETN